MLTVKATDYVVRNIKLPFGERRIIETSSRSPFFIFGYCHQPTSKKPVHQNKATLMCPEQ